MSRLSAAAAVSLLFSVSFVQAPDADAQTPINDILTERLRKLETICGEWQGMVGNESADVTFYMEDSSSAIGEMRVEEKVFFLHCFAEDMAEDDKFAVGGKDGYDYCIMQQSEGEVVSMIYLSVKDGKLTGISAGGSGVSTVTFSRRGGNAREYQYLDAETIDFDYDKWTTVSYLNTIEAYESYLADFPQGKYADAARKQIKSIRYEAQREEFEKKDQELWEKALTENSIEACQAYLDSPLEYKAYERLARGRLETLKAIDADKRGDHDAVLASLERADDYISLNRDMLALRMKNQELKSYDTYLKADTDLEAISRGMDFLNTYANSEKHDEVSDRVAYLMASSSQYLAGTPAEVILSYAKTEKTRKYVIKESAKAKRSRYRKSSNGSNLGFNLGIGAAVSRPIEVSAPVYGGHLLFSIGDNRNFLNFELGARYGYWNFVNREDPADVYDFHQLRLVAAPKFNLIRQKKSSFYLYVAPEAAYGYPIDPYGLRTYEANTLSFGGRIGFGIGHFDLSASYMLDYWPMVTESFTGSYYPTMVGIALTVYLSGSGR